MRKIVALIVFIQVLFDSYSQIPTNRPTIPTSPQAETIKKFGDHNISYFYGSLNISVPLYEINHHGFTLPINLLYSPMTIKPGYNYDVFGHGWSLSANSCISRTIEYLPDEDQNFKTISYDKLSQFINEEYYNNINSKLGYLNLAFDKFNVTLPDGSAFDFIIDGNNYTQPKAIVTDGRNVKISFVYNQSNIASFKVVDENGINYFFDEGDFPLFGTTNTNYTSNVSWKLTRIELPFTDEPILFFYNYTIQANHCNTVIEDGLTMSHHFVPLGPDNVIIDRAQAGQSIGHKMKILSRIEWGNNRLDFKFNDTNSISSHNYVTDIELSSNQTIIRKFILGITKHSGSNFGTFNLAKLNSIKFVNESDANGSEIYNFEYQNAEYSYSGTDHWGNSTHYPNVYGSNFNMFVEFDLENHGIVGPNGDNMSDKVYKLNKDENETTPYEKIKLRGSDYNFDYRSPIAPEAYGVLKKITYPTGGSTVYEFENHKYLSSTDSDGDYIMNENEKIVSNASGFRIRKITNYSAENVVSDIRNIRYGEQFINTSGNNSNFFNYGREYTPFQHTGVGVVFVEPNIKTYTEFSSINHKPGYNTLDFSYILKNMIVGLGPYGESDFINPICPSCEQFQIINGDTEWKWDCTISVQNFRRLLNGRPPVIYPFVTEYFGEIEDDRALYNPQKDIGKIEYYFEMKNEYDQFPEVLKSNKNVSFYESENYLYNKLKIKSIYKYDINSEDKFKLQKKETYNWLPDYTSILEYGNSNTFPSDIRIPLNLMYGDFVHERYFKYGNSLLSSVTTEEYIENKTIVSTTGYAYNKNRLMTKRVYNSDNTSLSTDYVYPDYINDDDTFVSSLLVGKNMIGIPVEIYNSKVNSYNEKTFISGEKTKYKKVNDKFIQPYQFLKMEIQNNDTSYCPNVEIVEFNNAGKPKLVKSNNSEQVLEYFIWSYNNQNIIAHFQNIRYEDVLIIENQIQNLFNINVDDLSKTTPDEDLVREIVNIPELNKFIINTYTYYPLSGLKSTTNPMGVTTYYNRDTQGRLIESYFIQNGVKSIIESYNYNFKNK